MGEQQGNRWLQTEDEVLAFYMNLLNFAVLFSLCKTEPKSYPKTQADWLARSKSLALNFCGSVLTLQELEHAVLRAGMATPRLSKSKLIERFPKFSPIDPRVRFALSRKERLVNFALFTPTKSISRWLPKNRSSPQLQIYAAETVRKQLSSNTKEYLARTVRVVPGKRLVVLPKILDWYGEDFEVSNGKEDVLYFVASVIPKAAANKLATMLAARYCSACANYSLVKEILYEDYAWDFLWEVA